MNRRKFVVPDDSINTTMMAVPNEREGIEIPSLCSNYSYKIGPKLKISMPGTSNNPHPLGKHGPGFDGRNTDQFFAHDATLNLHFAAELRPQETSRITPCTTAGLQNNSMTGQGVHTPLKPGNSEGLKIPSNQHNHSLSGYFSHEKSISFNREMFDGLGNESRIELSTQVQSLHRKR